MTKQKVEITVDGYRITGHRVPRKGEWYLMDGPDGEGDFHVRKSTGSTRYPRTIVKLKDEAK